MAAVKNKANPANTVKVIDKLSERVLSDDRVIMMEQRIMVKMDQNRITLWFKILSNIVAFLKHDFFN